MNKLCVIAMLLVGAASCFAQTVISHPTQFQLSTTLIDFETIPHGQPFPDYGAAALSTQWASLGVVIQDSSPENGAARWRSVDEEIPSHSGTNGISVGPVMRGGFVEFVFTDSLTLVPAVVQEAGLWVQNGFGFGEAASVVSFYDRVGNLIYSTPPLTPYDQFAGLRFDTGIHSTRIADTNYFLVDDLQFSQVIVVPEPSTFLFFVLSLFTLIFFKPCVRASSPDPKRCISGSAAELLHP